MLPDLYHRCLRWVEERDRLRPSSLVRAQLAEIIALEDELGASLPAQYEAHLLHFGAGTEHGGLAFWFHLDRTRSGNILDCNEQLQRSNGRPGAPKDFLAVYDSRDGEFFGFRKQGSSYGPEVFSWTSEEHKCHLHCPDLGSFYFDRIDLSFEDIEKVERGELALN